MGGGPGRARATWGGRQGNAGWGPPPQNQQPRNWCGLCLQKDHTGLWGFGYLSLSNLQLLLQIHTGPARRSERDGRWGALGAETWGGGFGSEQARCGTRSPFPAWE